MELEYISQPITTRGEATIFHTIDPNAPPGNRGAGGGVSGPILAAMMQESATLATITALRHTEQIMGTLEINIIIYDVHLENKYLPRQMY